MGLHGTVLIHYRMTESVTEQNKKSTWDSGRSTRFNQDAQRQEDHRRMKQICLFLTKLRLNTDKSEKPARKEVSYPGGLFCRIEAQWKAANAPQTKSISNQPRPKMRLSSLRSGIL
ncbi:hypothetical protein LOTGIDRAFT_174905 [Lottia gigantea]|uniref:Uncharacterized protein n=1 Tax=Lottia gigantea TaxID=225164 RepID=V3ZXL3_LOTGI|nr:hypothetical protein LOTGIDRAFT_174905 [Lottia gigantea]ESO96288.1 hypothetical protein LOTGIDRAFT_174905 [Lottia gigantea]